ncbi:hypothetical protein N7G274_000286 [Stereocaulon virgatum]|uniref:RNA-dependent RNA polymerase n=1 Tax=Stereocaulon virgatum TaxID=373712 RepID=A0ABR4AT07_9LECA
MEVFVRNLPDQASQKQIDSYFQKVLANLGIKTYHCQKLKSRGVATITILDTAEANRFLSIYGQPTFGARGYASSLQKLQFMGRSVNCSKSNREPDKHLLLTLEKDERDRYVAGQSRKPDIVPPKINGPKQGKDGQRAFNISWLKCGQWTYNGSDLFFANHYEERRQGRIVFGERMLFIKLGPGTQGSLANQIAVPYDSVQSFTVGQKSKPSLTFSLCEAPKFYRTSLVGVTNIGNSLETSMQQMEMQPKKNTFTRQRTTALSEIHGDIVPSCLCYRFMLSQPNDLDAVKALKNVPAIPASITWNTSTFDPTPFVDQMTRLDTLLVGNTYGSMPFQVKFQLQKLAQNGYLEPSKVVALLAFVDRHLKPSQNVASVTQALMNLAGYVPFAGPDTEASDLSVRTLSEYLVKSQESILRSNTYSINLTEQHDHMALIHKVMVTPTGIYLFGPELETKNRVLRKYSAFAAYFLSVSFCEEDGQSLYLDRQTSGQGIYHGRFKKILEGVINIAGREYEFLGFSHSLVTSCPDLLVHGPFYAKRFIGPRTFCDQRPGRL